MIESHPITTESDPIVVVALKFESTLEEDIVDDTKTIGHKLVEFCRNGLNLEAISSLYGPDIVSVEAVNNPDFPREMRGIDQVVAKNKKWYDMHEIHHASAEG